MSRQSLKVSKRDTSGRSPEARRLRRTGRVPGVVYRKGETGVPFSADGLELAALLRHGAHLVDVDVDGTKHTAVVKDYQVHPVRGDVLHVDFQEVSLDQRVVSVVSIHTEGTSPGVKAGGVLVEALHEISVESTPVDIPESVTVDISNLELGGQITLGEVVAPKGVTIVGDPDQLVISISIPRGVSAAAAEADEAAAADGEAAPADDAAAE